MSDFTMLVSSLTATSLGISWLAAAIWMFLRQRRDVLPLATPDAASREAVAKSLWEMYPAFPDDEPDTALFLLDESRRDYEGCVENNERMEAKATWLTGFIAGGAGQLTIFGSGSSDKALIQAGPFLYLTIVTAFASLASCLYIVRPKVRSHPSVSAFLSSATAYASKARFHLALALPKSITGHRSSSHGIAASTRSLGRPRKVP